MKVLLYICYHLHHTYINLPVRLSKYIRMWATQSQQTQRLRITVWRSRTKRKKKHEYTRQSRRARPHDERRVRFRVLIYYYHVSRRVSVQCVYARLAKTRKANWCRRLAHSGSLPSNFRPTRSAFQLEQPCIVCHRVNSYRILADNWVHWTSALQGIKQRTFFAFPASSSEYSFWGGPMNYLAYEKEALCYCLSSLSWSCGGEVYPSLCGAKNIIIICFHLKIATRSLLSTHLSTTEWRKKRSHWITEFTFQCIDSVLYNVYYICAVVYDYVPFTQFRDID